MSSSRLTIDGHGGRIGALVSRVSGGSVALLYAHLRLRSVANNQPSSSPIGVCRLPSTGNSGRKTERIQAKEKGINSLQSKGERRCSESVRLVTVKLGNGVLGGRVMSLLLLPKNHLEEFMPRLILLNHLADLKPFALLVSRDGVPHPATLRNLQSSLQRVRGHLGFSIYLSFGSERMPAKFIGAMVIRNERQSRVNRRTVLFRFA